MGTDEGGEVRMIGRQFAAFSEIDEGADAGCEKLVKLLYGGSLKRRPGVFAGKEERGSPVRVWDGSCDALGADGREWSVALSAFAVAAGSRDAVLLLHG